MSKHTKYAKYVLWMIQRYCLSRSMIRIIMPNEIETIEQEMAQLLDEYREIELQLGDKNRCHPNGTWFNAKEYWGWRRSAVSAYNKKKSEYSKPKKKRRELLLKRQECYLKLQFDPIDQLSIIKYLRLIVIRAIKDKEFPLSSNEEIVMDAAKFHLERAFQGYKRGKDNGI